MKWSNNLRAISDIVALINESKEGKHFTNKCKPCFNALENISNLYKESEISIRRPFSETIDELTNKGEKELIINSAYFKEIINFDPPIMDNKVLKKARYDPKDISNELKEEASKQHLKLINSFKGNDNKWTIINLCYLLYMIRCNLSHDGKTPRGLDLDKSKRDESICKTIFPLLEMIIDILLEYPSRKLICYGTLRKGQINEYIVESINEDSKQVYIFGDLETENELLYYKGDINNKIPAELINNELLYKNKMFEELDIFEGEKYKRELVPYELNGEILVGNIYVDNRRNVS